MSSRSGTFSKVTLGKVSYKGSSRNSKWRPRTVRGGRRAESALGKRKFGGKMARPIGGPNGAFIAPQITTTLKYADHVTRTSTTGVMSEYVFALNSIYDPDYTGGGHQPMGRDQLALLYNRYRVDKVHVNLRMIKTTDSLAMFGAMTANNTLSNFGSNLSTIMEQPDTVYGITSYSNYGSQSELHFKKTYDLHKITGVSKEKYRTDDAYSALMSASPSEVIDLHVLHLDLAEVSTVVAYYAIEVKFEVTCFDPIVITQS